MLIVRDQLIKLLVSVLSIDEISNFNFKIRCLNNINHFFFNQTDDKLKIFNLFWILWKIQSYVDWKHNICLK